MNSDAKQDCFSLVSLSDMEKLARKAYSDGYKDGVRDYLKKRLPSTRLKWFATGAIVTAIIAYHGQVHAADVNPYVSATLDWGNDEYRAPDPMTRIELGASYTAQETTIDLFGWHKSSAANGIQADGHEDVEGFGIRVRWEPEL